jgi:sugar phosphate isomerase/epimerase
MISIGTTFNYDIPLETQLPLIREAGFSHISLGGGKTEHSGYLGDDGRKRIRRLLSANDIGVCSVHCPFDDKADLSSPDKALAASALEIFKRCLDAAFFLNAEGIIFHPCSFRSNDPEIRKEVLVKQISFLLDHINQETLFLAIENLPSNPVNKIVTHSLDVVTHRRYGFCYDTSHDNLVSQPLEILRKYGDRLVTTHLSDNHGEKDDHLLPFEGTYPWERFCDLFSKIDFQGIFLLEVEMRESAFKEPRSFLKEAYLRGKRLMVESKNED